MTPLVSYTLRPSYTAVSHGRSAPPFLPPLWRLSAISEMPASLAAVWHRQLSSRPCSVGGEDVPVAFGIWISVRVATRDLIASHPVLRRALTAWISGFQWVAGWLDWETHWFWLGFEEAVGSPELTFVNTGCRGRIGVDFCWEFQDKGDLAISSNAEYSAMDTTIRPGLVFVLVGVADNGVDVAAGIS